MTSFGSDRPYLPVVPNPQDPRLTERVSGTDQDAKIDAKLTEQGIDHEFHSYEGAGHAFQNFHNPQGYRSAATADSMAKMFAWLGKNL